jgi:Uma2 family endonuclease
MARSDSPIRTGLSFEDYLVFEKTSSVKHEFIDGQLFMMAGASERHNRLAFLLAMQLETVTQEQPCQVSLLDLLVRTPNNLAYYPDVFVVCDPSDDETHVKRKPCLIIEILSDSTEVIDRGEKLGNYTQISTLQAYILLSQTEPKLEIYQRNLHGWNYNLYKMGDTILLPCIDFKLELESLYAKL